MNNISVINPDRQGYGRHEIVTACQTWAAINSHLTFAQGISDGLVFDEQPEKLLNPHSVAAARLRVKAALDLLNDLAQLTGLDEPEGN